MYTFILQQNILQAEDHCESVGAATSSITSICFTNSSDVVLFGFFLLTFTLQEFEFVC